MFELLSEHRQVATQWTGECKRSQETVPVTVRTLLAGDRSGSQHTKPVARESRPVAFETPSPSELADVFGLLANELRVAVVRELWLAFPEPLSFSALRERVGGPDSGTFNYHLNELQPAFVQSVEDHYTLTYAGRQVVGVAVSGRLDGQDGPTVEATPAGECLSCPATTELRYEAGVATVECPECGLLAAETAVPPAVIQSVERESTERESTARESAERGSTQRESADREPTDREPTERESVVRVVSDHLRRTAERLARGFCTHCEGRVDATLVGDTDDEAVTHRRELGVRFDCRVCGAEPRLNVGAVLLADPAVVSLLTDAGVDLRERYAWELAPLLDPEAARTTSEGDESRLRVTFAVEGERLAVTVDDTASVVETERV